jgi:hypothetical protein
MRNRSTHRQQHKSLMLFLRLHIRLPSRTSKPFLRISRVLGILLPAMRQARPQPLQLVNHLDCHSKPQQEMGHTRRLLRHRVLLIRPLHPRTKHRRKQRLKASRHGQESALHLRQNRDQERHQRGTALVAMRQSKLSLRRTLFQARPRYPGDLLWLV